MKLARIAVSPVVLSTLARTSPKDEWWHLRGGLPLSAEFVFAYWDDRERCFWCVFTHESFDEVREGWPIPVQDSPMVETLIDRGDFEATEEVRQTLAVAVDRWNAYVEDARSPVAAAARSIGLGYAQQLIARLGRETTGGSAQ